MVTGDSHSSVIADKVFRSWDYPVFVLLTAAGLASIAFFLSHWFSEEAWLEYPVLFVLLTLLLIINLTNNQGRWFLLPSMRRPKSMPPQPGWKVGVATSFVPDEESLEMLEETLTALLALDYPHETWVLDEGDSEQVQLLCRRLGANHFSRRLRPQYQSGSGAFQSHWKHGNYNAWLHEVAFARYDLIAVFDPDHVPHPTFLNKVLGYFADQRIAYVQVAQAYSNQKASFIARGAAEEVYSFYSSIQMAGYGFGHPVIIGSHTTHRVAALKQVGGFPAHNADDILITLLYRASRWQGVYVPQILARGLTPVDWNGYLTQQRRWARAVLDIRLRLYPQLSTKLPIGTRVMSFVHGLSYVNKSLTMCAAVAILAFMLASGVTLRVFSDRVVRDLVILFVALQACEFYRQRFYLDWQHEWGFHWRVALLQYAKWPYLLFALVDVLLGRTGSFGLTRKVKARSPQYRLLWPHLCVAPIVGGAWVFGIASGRIADPSLHVAAALFVIGSLALIVSGHVTSPEPYKKSTPGLSDIRKSGK